jgi:hypothetical protein
MLRIKYAPGYDTRQGQRPGRQLLCTWVTIDDPDPNLEGGAPRVWAQGAARGGATFGRLEGAWYGNGSIFIVSTSGGNVGAGQVFEYRPLGPVEGFLTLLYESPDRNVLDAPDNLCVSPRGGLVLCEDGSGDEFVHGLTPRGRIFKFAKNIVPGQEGSEFAGATFSPDGETLFFNLQGPGLTFAVWPKPVTRGPGAASEPLPHPATDLSYRSHPTSLRSTRNTCSLLPFRRPPCAATGAPPAVFPARCWRRRSAGRRPARRHAGRGAGDDLFLRRHVLPVRQQDPDPVLGRRLLARDGANVRVRRRRQRGRGDDRRGRVRPAPAALQQHLVEIAQYDDALQAFVDAASCGSIRPRARHLDAYGEIQLDGGSYFLGLEVAPQFPFNPDEDPLDFTDGTGSARSGAWALDITVNRDGAFVIPEPGTVSLIVCGALPLLLAARRRRGPADAGLITAPFQHPRSMRTGS